MQGRAGGRAELEIVTSGVRGGEEGVAGAEAQAGDPGRPARPGRGDDARGACRRPLSRVRRRRWRRRAAGAERDACREMAYASTPSVGERATRRRRRCRETTRTPGQITPKRVDTPTRDDKHSQKHRSAAGRPGGPARATRPASTTRTWSGTSRTAPSTCRTTPKSRRSSTARTTCRA